MDNLNDVTEREHLEGVYLPPPIESGTTAPIPITVAANTIVDLVLVYCPLAGQTMLAQAPAWSGLEPEDSVVLDHEAPAVVKSCITICKAEVAYGFILGLANTTTPLKKIRKKVRYEEFSYLDEKEGATDG